jgi:chaperonin GroEL (HSP60 family)
LFIQYFVEAGAMAVRRCKKADLKRIAKATGATLLSSMANLEGITLLIIQPFSDVRNYIYFIL